MAELGPKNGDTWTPQLPGPAPAVANPLVVADVVVDKEAENSVVAREKAIADSRREAFRKLAERNMSPAEFKKFKLPKDTEIATLVQDFEIQDEQMSSTRYVGTFTVRFRDAVRNYIDVKDDPAPQVNVASEDTRTNYVQIQPGESVPPAESVEEAPLADDGMSTTAPADPQEAMESRSDWKESVYGQKGRPSLVRADGPVVTSDAEPIAKSVLILPYYENMDGQTLLWEESNPWLLMWQGALPKTSSGRQFYVPLGDISDISAGNSNGVWEGDYRAIDKLLKNYGAEQAVLAVANRSGPDLTIEIYTYSHKNLRRRDTLKPYAAEMAQTEAFRRGISETVSYLQSAPAKRPSLVTETVTTTTTTTLRGRPSLQTVIVDSHGEDIPAASGYVPGTAWSPTLAAAATRISASMQFNDSRSWMEMQKRLAGMNPPVKVEVNALSARSVDFTLTSSAPLGAVKQAFYSRGIELDPPMMQAGRPVYDLRLSPLTR
ncbi:MAG TPA: DUF2066 domain-containing protein [Patescibacteria group bacterium]|nr:DUF2066 domain-containing protein [Patescibacteria group bacterium]